MGYNLRPRMMSLVLTLVTMGLISETSEMTDYCDTDVFRAHCSHGEVVLMQQALFGRMELGTCLTLDVLLGCFRDVLSYMDRWCSGRISCDVPVINLQLLTNPCTTDMRGYLQASFTCIPVVEHGDNCCRFPNDQALVTADNGYLSTSVTLDTGCGDRDCPWQLHALEGQRIHVSLYDFALYDFSDENTNSAANGDQCVLYATIKETAVGAIVKVCGGGKRKRHVYMSTTNAIEIEIHIDEQNGEDLGVLHFVLEYGVVGHLPTGCADPSLPVNAVMQREGDHATISCPGLSTAIWEITCRDGQWLGSYVNCSMGSSSGNGDTINNTRDPKQIRLEPRMIVVLIVTVAVILAIGIILIGILCVLRAKRSTNQQYSKGSRSRVNKSPVKSYDDFQDGERDNLKSANQVDIPHYVHNWSKHNPPYISSPTLVTGNLMGNNADCDWDTNKKPISRDRSLSVGNKEITCCDHDTSSATFVADGNTDNEYKTPAV